MTARLTPVEEQWYSRAATDPQCMAYQNVPDARGDVQFRCLLRPGHPGPHVETRGRHWPQQVEEPGLRWPDEGPQPDGTRTAEQWLNAMGEDAAIIREKVREVVTMDRPEEISKTLALAVKEAQRLTRDIYRYGEEVYGIARGLIDEAGRGL